MVAAKNKANCYKSGIPNNQWSRHCPTNQLIDRLTVRPLYSVAFAHTPKNSNYVYLKLMSILNSTCPWDNANVLQYIDWYGISRFLLHKVALILLFSVSESSTYWQISLTSSIFKCGLQLGVEVVKSLLSGLKTKFKPKIQNKVCKKQVRIHEISRSPSSFLARQKKKGYGRTDGPTDGWTHPLIESWLTTKKLNESLSINVGRKAWLIDILRTYY